MSRYTHKTYVLDGVSPSDVAREIITGGQQTEAFFIQDLDEAYRRIQYFKRKMPRVQIFYAIKANDSDMLLKLVASLGLGFDCAAPGEIHKVLALNVDPRSVIFASPLKLPEWMSYAQKSGIKCATFDTSFELKRVKQFWPDASLLIRIRVDSNSVYRLGEKYGCDFETEAIDLLEEAARLGIKVVGVAFHVGSVCCSTDSHMAGIRMAKELFEHEARMGRRMSILDIGGGFLSEKTTDIDEVSRLINSALKEHFPDKDVQIIAEPGRYICDSSMSLYTSINAVKRVRRNDEYINMIYINDGVYGTLQFAESWQTVSKFERTSKKNMEETEPAILWGNSLDSLDRVMRDAALALPSCSELDWLVFPVRGAYSIVFCSSFACFQQPRIRPVISIESWEKIRHSDVFDAEDFIEDPDISKPFPSSLPRVLNAASYLKSDAILKS